MKALTLGTIGILLWLEGFYSKAPHFLQHFKTIRINPKRILDANDWANVTNALLNSSEDTKEESTLHLNHLYFPEKLWLQAFKLHSKEESNEVVTQSSLRDTVVRLDLSCNGFDQNHYRIISSSLPSFPNLHEIIFDSCPLDENAFRILIHAFRKISNLTSLSFSHCHLKDKSMYLLHSFLHGTNSSQIKQLDLSRSGLTVAGLQSLFPFIPNQKSKKKLTPLSIETLDLSYNVLEDEGIDYLCQIIEKNHFPSLCHLILKEVKCSDRGTLNLLETLTKVCEDNHVKLATLDISGNPLVPGKLKSAESKGKLLKIYETNSALLSNAMKATVSTFSQAYTSESSAQSRRYLNKSKSKSSSKRNVKSDPKSSTNKGNNVKSQQGDYYKASKILLHFIRAARDLKFCILRKTNLQSSFLQLLEKVYSKEYVKERVLESQETILKRCDLGSNDLTPSEKSTFLSIVNNS